MFSHYEQCPRCAERGKDSRRDNLAVWKDGGRHCFSCGFHSHPSISSHWTKTPIELEAKAKRILPDDFTWDIPARCWQWLLQYGLPYDYWKPIVGWSEKYQRLVFRVGDPLEFSIGRSFGEEVSGVRRKWHVWGDSHRSVFVADVRRKGEGPILLVEDFISAHKVGQVTQTVCLFGTRIYPMHIKYLREQNKPIILWLDSDQGDNMPKKAANLSILTGCKVNIINTDKDPKEYNHEEITNYLSKCIN